MMIEEQLLQYGILGLWTLTLLGKQFFYDKAMKKVIENNTIALTRVYEVVKSCPQRR